MQKIDVTALKAAKSFLTLRYLTAKRRFSGFEATSTSGHQLE